MEAKRKGGVKTRIRTNRGTRPTMPIPTNKNLPCSNPAKLQQTHHPRRISRVGRPAPRRQDQVRTSLASHLRRSASRPRQRRSPKSRKSSTPLLPSNLPRSHGAKLKVFRRIGGGIMTGVATMIVNEIANGNVTGNVNGIATGIAIGTGIGTGTEIATSCGALRPSPPRRGRRDSTRSQDNSRSRLRSK